MCLSSDKRTYLELEQSPPVTLVERSALLRLVLMQASHLHNLSAVFPDPRLVGACWLTFGGRVGRASKQTLTSGLTVRDLWLLDMAPYYEALCKSLDWQMDMDLLSKMKKANEEELKRLDEELEDAEKNLGESDDWM